MSNNISLDRSAQYYIPAAIQGFPSVFSTSSSFKYKRSAPLVHIYDCKKKGNQIIMEKTLHHSSKENQAIGTHLLILAASAILLYMLIHTYVRTMTAGDDEEISLAATLAFLTGIYTGRFISRFWINRNKNAPNWLLLLLPALIISCAFLCALYATSLQSHWTFMYMLFFGLPFFILSVALGMFIKLIRTKIHGQLHEAQASAAHSESELQLLQSQLSPHFLFNTLNNLYGLSITQHDKIPPLLLKLSELLRYSVYEAKEMFVPLKDELEYMLNYIEFEKIRIGDRLLLTTDIEKTTGNGDKIAPMIFIVFLENAFKHSKNTCEQKISIDIALKIWRDSLLFSIKNSYDSAVTNTADREKNNGLGLLNVRKRLELLYPDKFDLKVQDENNFYSVMLRIKIK